MDASFPPKPGTFSIDCNMSSEVRESLAALPSNPKLSSMYLDLFTIHIAFRREPLLPMLLIISQDLVYNKTEAMEICNLYLTFSPQASCSNSFIAQEDINSLVTGGYSELGSEKKVHGPSLQ